MKRIIVFLQLMLSLTACNNDFLNEKTLAAESKEATGIMVSPDWLEAYYEVYCDIQNTDFKIISKPEWLDVSSTSGRFENNIATFRCKATENRDFADYGIYADLMYLQTSAGETIAITVSCLIAGNPKINVQYTSKQYISNDFFCELTIKNEGKGILLWAINSYPDWIKFTNFRDSEQNLNGILRPNEEITFHISNPEAPYPESFDEEIEIVSNDASRPSVKIGLPGSMDEGKLGIDINTLDFGRELTRISAAIINNGSGILFFSLKDLPEWLRVAPQNLYLSAGISLVLDFYCDRDKLPLENLSTTINLHTSDPQNRIVPLTVTVRNSNTNEPNVRGIEGSVTDAWMDKDADILYITTSQPNKQKISHSQRQIIP